MGHRIGRVTAVDAATCRVRVAFEADDELTSWWYPVLQRRTLGDRFYSMPALDEHVVCLTDENGEEGVVIGSIYSDAAPPPAADVHVNSLTMTDGTVIEYDGAAHLLSIQVTGDSARVAISVSGEATVRADAGVVIEVPAGKHVLVGGEGGEELVTRTFLESYYLQHQHLSAAPGSPTSPPIVRAPCAPGADLTAKQKSE